MEVMIKVFVIVLPASRNFYFSKNKTYGMLKNKKVVECRNILPYERRKIKMSFDTSAFSEMMTKSLGAMTLEKLLTGILTLIVCLIVIRIVTKIVNRITPKVKWDPRVEKYLTSGIKIVLYILTALIVADSFGIPVTSLIALVSVFGLAISLAVQDVLSNIASGLVILFSRPFDLGDYVGTNDGEGTVAEISLTHVKLDTPDGQRIMLPTSNMVAGKIINYTTLGVRRANHAICVSYDCATDDVRASCLKAISRVKGVLDDPAPAVVINTYGDSAIEYRVRFWTKTEDYWDAHFQSMEEIRRAFDEDGIIMTYNHLNVHIVETEKK